MKLSIIVPAYNEEKSIDITIKKLQKLKNIGELIVVDDGSTDGTKDRLSKYKGVKVLTHRRNLGYGAALKSGFSKATNEYVGFIDADLTYPPSMLPVFLKILIDEKLDCVWGNRFVKKENKMSTIREIGNFFMSLIISIIFLKKISDVNSGERVFRREILKEINYKTLPDDLHFITAFTKRLLVKDKRFKEIPISYYSRRGKSKLKIFKHGFLMLHALLFD